MMGMMQQTPNFYEFPTTSKTDGMGQLNMPANSYDNTQGNLMNRFSPKVSLGSDINGVF